MCRRENLVALLNDPGALKLLYSANLSCLGGCVTSLFKAGGDAPSSFLQLLEQKSYTLQTRADAVNISTIFNLFAKRQQHCVDSLARMLNNEASTFMKLADERAVAAALEGFLALEEESPGLLLAFEAATETEWGKRTTRAYRKLSEA